MNGNVNCRIEFNAVKALNYWKSLFTDEVVSQAQKLAAKSSHPEMVTLLHYRQAAQLAVQALSAAIHDGEHDSESQAA